MGTKYFAQYLAHIPYVLSIVPNLTYFIRPHTCFFENKENFRVRRKTKLNVLCNSDFLLPGLFLEKDSKKF